MSFIIERACNSCGKLYALLEGFYSNGREYGDGRVTRCIPCIKQSVSENRELKAEVIREQQRQRYLTDPEYRERLLANNVHYRKTVRGKRAQQRARIAWKVTHPEQYAEIQRRWNKTRGSALKAAARARAKAKAKATTETLHVERSPDLHSVPGTPVREDPGQHWRAHDGAGAQGDR